MLYVDGDTDRVQNISDATSWSGDAGEDPGHSAARLHHPQLSVEQEVEREHSAEGRRAHFGLWQHRYCY